MSNIQILAFVVISCFICNVYGSEQTLNVGFYNTAQTMNLLESINDISGNPPQQQTKQIEALIEESNELDLDIICLSNLLATKQLEQYAESLNDIFPYSFSQLDVKPSTDFDLPRTACGVEDFAKISSNCTSHALYECDKILRAPETDIKDFGLCMAKSCPLDYENILYSECKSCMNIFTEANNVDPDTPLMALGLASWGCGMEQQRIMNFTDGTLILSKYEIKSSMSVPLESFIFYQQRLNLINVDFNDNDVYVGCIDLNPTTYKDNVASYVAVTEQQRIAQIHDHEELNEYQIEKVIENIDLFTPSSQATILLMGDLGIGNTWNENNLDLLTNEGYLSYNNDECTFCVDETDDLYNPLAATPSNLFDSSTSKDLDHILICDENNNFDVIDYQRIMTEKGFVDENGQELPFSFRYGVYMQLQDLSIGDGMTGRDEDNKDDGKNGNDRNK